MGTGGGHGGCRAPKPQRDPSPGLWLGLPAKAVKGPAPQILGGQRGGGQDAGPEDLGPDPACGAVPLVGLPAGAVRGGEVRSQLPYPLWGPGDPCCAMGPGGTSSPPPSCPGGLCPGAGSAAPGAKSLPGPGRRGAGRARGCQPYGAASPRAGAVAAAAAWGRDGTWELLPALPGRRFAAGTHCHRQEQVGPAGGSVL